MPLVTIPITCEGTTPEQEAALIKGATDLLADVLNKPPALTFVVMQEVERRTGAWMDCPRQSTGVRPRPGHPVSRSDNAFSISLRMRATNSATGNARASGAPCPAHWAPYPNSPAAFAAACSAFPAS
jgi:4-oxalocrotonate tautomerase family enzyme